LIYADIKRGIVKPLPKTFFNACEIEQAFRYLATSKHIGKVVLRMRESEQSLESLPIAVKPQLTFNYDCSVILVGGLGGFGLELADWLVLRGCRKLVLNSSRGITTSYQRLRIKTWQSVGVQVTVSTANATEREGCEKLVQEAKALGPVNSIFNLAVKLQDALFENQTEEMFAASLKPKAVATKFLDEVSQKHCPELQHFVVFSSVSCGRGNAGQSNYGMANAVMERIVERRNRCGLPATAIQWGAIGEVGLVAEMMESQHIDLEIGGTLQQRIASCLEVLDTLLSSNEAVVSSMIVAEKKLLSAANKKNIIEFILNILGVRNVNAISKDSSLGNLGLDSMMVVEIQQILEREFETLLTATELRSLTLNELEKTILSKNASLADVQKINLNIDMFIRNIADDTNSDESILKVNDCTDDDGKVLIVPGFEGMSGEVWKQLAGKLKRQTFILQHGRAYEATNFDKLLSAVVDDVAEFFKNSSKFYIIGYSFGALLAMKLAQVLESSGMTGQLVLVDGSPLFVRSLTQVIAPHNDDETFILMSYGKKILGSDFEQGIKQILAEASWNSKVQKFIEIGSAHSNYNHEVANVMLTGQLNRIKMMKHVDIASFHSIQSSPITLIRTTEASIKSMSDDYGLKKFSALPIQIHQVEGDHYTILKNDKLAGLLNDVQK